MRVVRVTDLPIVIRVATPREVVVALPRTKPTDEVLTLASLVLSSAEFEELQADLTRLPRAVPTPRSLRSR